MRRPGQRLAPGAALLAAGLLSACATQNNNLVVVLPEDNGHVGAVQVESGGAKTLLDHAYAAASGGGDSVKPATLQAAAVAQIFAKALAAEPIPPASYTLYFVADSDALTDDSKLQFEKVFGEISRRQASELVVTGHTDTMGDPAYNDALSLKRAQAVRLLLLARKLPPDSVIAVGRGERQLLVATPDQTPEPRNRRVEITVR
ncbi:MAG: OmpA family protein [Nevskia sp.]|nr:OmpA family protein [Nevskia sp.]